MREKWQKQMPLLPRITDHPQARELQAISDLIEANPIISERVRQDLEGGKVVSHRKGAKGMSAEQVLRCAVVKSLFGFTYEELAFHLSDSQAISWFCRIGIADKGFKKSALNKNIKGISDSTWALINADLVGYAKKENIDQGRKVRFDCTGVETDIHRPKDSNQLWDCVRVLTRLMERARDKTGVRILGYHNHSRVAKKRMLSILNSGGRKRKAAYADLIRTTRRVLRYARKTAEALAGRDLYALALSLKLSEVADLAEKVIDQAERRVIRGEAVPAREKVVSIFEPHTDIIVKDRREPLFGHKICLAGGASNLILDCWILTGNPADSTLAVPMLDRQKRVYGRYPLKVTFDGGFASKKNLRDAKARKVKDVCFAKKRGLAESDMCRSRYVYRSLRRFRAGIESGISWLKRSLGLTRCNWKGWEAFKSYVWSSIVSANLLTMARCKTAPT